MNFLVENLNLILYVLIFISGALIGSFLNVIADRLILGETIIYGRSRCDHCKKDLSPKNLVPVLSFLLQKGKCSFCGKRLSIFYPVSEILTGLLFVLAAKLSFIFNFNAGLLHYIYFIYLLIIFSAFILLFLTDSKYGYIPDHITFPAILVTIIYLVVSISVSYNTSVEKFSNEAFGRLLIEVGFLKDQLRYNINSAIYTLISAVVIGLMFWLLTKIKNGKAMGTGDIWLAVLIALFNGFYSNILAIFLGFVFGAVFSILLIVLKLKTIKDTIPFGPFLILGSIVTLLWGNYIFNWYFGLN